MVLSRFTKSSVSAVKTNNMRKMMMSVGSPNANMTSTSNESIFCIVIETPIKSANMPVIWPDRMRISDHLFALIPRLNKTPVVSVGEKGGCINAADNNNDCIKPRLSSKPRFYNSHRLKFNTLPHY